MNPNQLSNHIAATYQALRIGLAIIAFLFPPWLVVGGMIFDKVAWQKSMSAYYHASPDSQEVARQKDAAQKNPAPVAGEPIRHGQGTMRDWFVGLLFGVGIVLYLYKGFTWLENWALNIAGVMAWGVALFPMPWPGFSGIRLPLLGPNGTLHGACAITLFFCIAYVCIFRAADTLSLIKDEARREIFRKRYRVLGHLMWLFPVKSLGSLHYADATQVSHFPHGDVRCLDIRGLLVGKEPGDRGNQCGQEGAVRAAQGGRAYRLAFQ